MRLMIKQLLSATQGLLTLANAHGLNSVVAYRVSRNLNAIEDEIKEFNDAQKRVLDEYFEKDEKGSPIVENNSYKIKAGCIDIANKEIFALQKETVDIDIKKMSLEDIDKAGLSALEINSLEFMIDLKGEQVCQ